MKICKICKIEKHLSEFYSQNKHSKTKGDYIYYNPECKECTVKRSSEFRKNDPDGIKRLKENEYNRNRTDRVREIKRISSEKRRKEGKLKEWQRNNPDKLNMYNKNHRKHDISKKEWIACKEYFNYECAYCGLIEKEHKELYNQQLHKEHVDHNGANDLSNCIPACKVCNSLKNTREFEIWFKDLPTYTKEKFNKITDWLNGDFKLFSK